MGKKRLTKSEWEELARAAEDAPGRGYPLYDEEEDTTSNDDVPDGEATEAEYRLALSEEHNTGSFARKFLLAIIRAHEPDPTVKDTDSQRLRTAAKALFGSSKMAKNVSLWRNDDHLALNHMASMYVRDRGGPAMSLGPDPLRWLDRNPLQARTKKELAKLARQVFPYTSSERTLENKFGKKTRELCAQVVHCSDLPGSLHLQNLKRLKKMFEPLGIKMNIDD